MLGMEIMADEVTLVIPFKLSTIIILVKIIITITILIKIIFTFLPFAVVGTTDRLILYNGDSINVYNIDTINNKLDGWLYMGRGGIPKASHLMDALPLRTVMGLLYGNFFFHLRDGNQSGESIMQELAKTASRVDAALDTHTVPAIGSYNRIPNIDDV
jgi:hypothetical protein